MPQLLFIILYTTIIYGDFFTVPLDPLKFIFIIFCFFFARGQRKSALFFTVISDFFLLFTPYVVPGIFFFCIAQFLHLPKNKRQAGLIPLLPACLFLFVHPFAAVVGLYATLLSCNLFFAFQNYLKEHTRQSTYVAAGFFLFVCCDITVLLYNTLSPVWTMGRYIWLFYAPSQWLFSLSSCCRETVPVPE